MSLMPKRDILMKQPFREERIKIVEFPNDFSFSHDVDNIKVRQAKTTTIFGFGTSVPRYNMQLI